MRIKGIVRTATLEENPPGSDRIEMTLKVQGVGAGQPRTLVVPYDLLLTDDSLDPDQVAGKGFEAEADPDQAGRWIVSWIALATGRVLRRPEP
jgi:hypothetical protein